MRQTIQSGEQCLVCDCSQFFYGGVSSFIKENMEYIPRGNLVRMICNNACKTLGTVPRI